MILLCAVCLVLGTAAENVKRQSGYLVNQKSLQQNYPPAQPFRSPDDYEQIDVNTIAPTHPSIHQIAQKTNIGYRTQEPPRGRPQEFQQGKRPLLKEPLKEEELEEEEKEEPDRLTLLLPQSKFSCIGKRTGYYADEGLNCEVFHYCQDNAKHSWICPEGFLFHQVHLICMPPSHDNICAKSSQYHFINDYLYKAINMDEASQMPNVSLRYSERYYPNNFYSEEDVSRTPQPLEDPQPRVPIPNQQHLIQESSHRPTSGRQPNQVFHSPEEVNIPLQHRRPQTVRTFARPTNEHVEY